MVTRRNQIIAGLLLFTIALAVVFRPHPYDHGNTLVVLSSSAPDSLDPGMSYTALSWQMMFNVYDGLLTYKKAGGAAGNQLVPDLAVAMPVVSDGGKTYSFKMRAGVKFGPPANREVLPSDIKWAIERLYKLPSPGLGFYQSIDGADAYAKGKAKDLSGIVVDDTARTIQFHLTAADGTFSYKLAMMFAVAVPKETPAKDMSFRGFVPATGPYHFSEYTAQRRILITKNPVFQSWSPDVPAGHVNGIDIQLGPAADNSVTKIKQGTADMSLDGIPAARLPGLKRDPSQKTNIHQEIQATTQYIFMNTQVAPFNNKLLRQAVNYAVDRRALVKLLGGRAVATENVLPPLLPGFKAHNLYPGPDLAKARQLVAASGVKPGKISFWCLAGTGPNPTAEYMQKVLNDLGFTTELKCLDFAVFFTTIGNPSTKAQIGFANWGQDFPEGSDFVDVLLNGKRITPQGNNNAAMYQGQDAEIARVNLLLDQKQRDAAWSALDEKIMEDAPWAPYANPVSYTLTSSRVRNFVAHPTYGMLFMLADLDQKKTSGGGAP